MCITRHHEGTRLTCYDLKKNGAAQRHTVFSKVCILFKNQKNGGLWDPNTCPLFKKILILYYMCITRHHEGTRLTCYDLKKNGAAQRHTVFSKVCILFKNQENGGLWDPNTCPLFKNISKLYCICNSCHHEGTRLTCYDLKKMAPQNVTLYYKNFAFCS